MRGDTPQGVMRHPPGMFNQDKTFRKGDAMKGWIVCFIGLLLFGCASVRDVRILDREMDKVYSGMNALRKEHDSIKNEHDSIKNEMSALKADLVAENQKLKSDLLLRLENLESDFRSLSTGVEEYKEFLKKPSKEVDRIRLDTEGRLRTLEDREKTTEERDRVQESKLKETEGKLKEMEGKLKETEDRLKGLEGKITALASKQAESERAASAKEVPTEFKGISTGMGDIYKDSYETFYKGDLVGARKKFEAFLRQYPNTELSDNAQFWIGETYYLKKDYERAILEYEKAIVKYPEGDKIPAALFKQALAFLELGDKTNARTLLRRVIEKYPRSDQAEMARKRLEAIK